MAATLLLIIFGFTTKSSALCAILLVIQFLAIFKYASSMIPGFKKFFCCCCKMGKKAATAASAAV